jgi:glycerol-3-phosphate dehydrogenase (NAD+)
MSSSSRSQSLWYNVAIASASLGLGIGISTYFLRLRDRERLRRAASRTLKHLKKGQRAALGPLLDRNPHEKVTILVIGAGAYGTAMAFTAAMNQHDVVIFMRDAKQCEYINTQHYNPKYLSEYKLPNNIRGICNEVQLKKELETPGVVVILALPCQKTPDWLEEHREMIPSNVLLCSTAKGLYLPTKQLIGHAILDALDRAQQPLAFLSGPSFAAEIMQQNPTAVVVASDQLFLAVKLQKILSNTTFFRVYTSADPIGVQLGGALKNPLAVGAGMITGMGFGTNTLAACVTRASRELCDLCIAMGGNPKTIDGLSGIGDLMLTCFSSQSRNQRCGQRLIKGESVADIEKDYTVEGVPTADVAVAYADMCGLELPLFRVVYDLIHKNITAEEAPQYLMGRPLLQETSRTHMAYTSLS